MSERLAHLAAAHLVQSTTVPLIVYDPDGTILLWTAGIQAILGFSAADAVGRSIFDLVIPHDAADEQRAWMQRALAEGSVSFRGRRRCKDGTVLETDLTLRAIDLGNGERVIVSTARNYRAAYDGFAQRTAALEAAGAAARQASQLKSAFIAGLSHDLRAPLNGIVGFADLLAAEKAGPLTPTQRRYLGHIVTSARHLQDSVDRVLDLARIEAGMIEFHPEPTDLAALAEEVERALHALAVQKRLGVTITTSPDLDAAVVDPARFRDVLYNLLTNALKFTEPGGLVEVRLQPEDAAHVRLEVSDTGQGIAAEDLPRLFTPFQQLSPRREGTGLGLALVKQLVEAQGGRVGARSTAGQGSTFWVVLPTAAAVPGGPRHETSGAASPPQLSPN